MAPSSIELWSLTLKQFSFKILPIPSLCSLVYSQFIFAMDHLSNVLFMTTVDGIEYGGSPFSVLPFGWSCFFLQMCHCIIVYFVKQFIYFAFFFFVWYILSIFWTYLSAIQNPLFVSIIGRLCSRCRVKRRWCSQSSKLRDIRQNIH